MGARTVDPNGLWWDLKWVLRWETSPCCPQSLSDPRTALGSLCTPGIQPGIEIVCSPLKSVLWLASMIQVFSSNVCLAQGNLFGRPDLKMLTQAVPAACQDSRPSNQKKMMQNKFCLATFFPNCYTAENTMYVSSILYIR